MKELSAGILFFTNDKRLFMGRMTNTYVQGRGSRWDIPKGHVEPGETPKEAAIRECQEETGFTEFDQDLLYDLGRHDYASNKDIHLFGYMLPVSPEMFRNCRCTAYHKDENGIPFPEIDAFALIKPSQWKYVMGPSLYKIMTQMYSTAQ